MGFDDDIAVRRTGDGLWAGEVVEGWRTPRGPLGGYVMGIVLRAIEAELDDPARLARSATMHFLRVPDEGPVSIAVTIERSGRSLSSLSARLEQGERLIGIALAAFSVPWEGSPRGGVDPPEVDPPSGREPFVAPREGIRAPDFTGRLTIQPRLGEPPFSGAEEGLAGGWIGLIEDRPLDAATIAVLADAWFPSPWPRLAELAPAPTIDLTIHFRAPLPLADSLLLGRFTNRVVRDGFFDEDGELWTPDGTLVVQSRQLGLLIGAG